MNKYPINERHGIPEGPKYPDSFMVIQDPYHYITKLSLEQHIRSAVGSLAQAFYSGNLHENKPTGDIHHEELSAIFNDEYQNMVNNLKRGCSATSCEEAIFETICCVFQSNELKKRFSKAMTWALCADLLFQEGFKDNAWSALIEYKKHEFSVNLALNEEHNLFISNRNKASGELSYKDRQHLKNYLVELLESQAPLNGWRAAKNAANTLAPTVLERHMNSTHSSRFHPEIEKVEKWLLNWINTNKECKNKYKEFK